VLPLLFVRHLVDKTACADWSSGKGRSVLMDPTIMRGVGLAKCQC